MSTHICTAIFISLFFTACIRHTEVYQDSEYAQKIKIENRKKFAQEGLTHIKSSNLYPLPTNIIWERFRTQKYKYTSVDDARLLFCQKFEEYITPFMENSDNKDFLPSERTIELMITFCDIDNHLLHTPYICKVQNERGYIVYTVFNVPEKRMDIIHKETFETGYNIYLQTKNANRQN